MATLVPWCLYEECAHVVIVRPTWRAFPPWLPDPALPCPALPIPALPGPAGHTGLRGAPAAAVAVAATPCGA